MASPSGTLPPPAAPPTAGPPTGRAPRPSGPSPSGKTPRPAKAAPNRPTQRRAGPMGQQRKPRTGGPTSQGTSGSRRVSTAGPGYKPAAKNSGNIPRSSPAGQKPQILRGSQYQNVLLAEFLGTLALTVLTPVARNQAKQGLSPYAGADMVKLASIVLLFFLLALVSSAGPAAARLCAWLGGLVLITDGLYEAANLSKDLALFTGKVDQAANPGASQQ